MTWSRQVHSTFFLYRRRWSTKRVGWPFFEPVLLQRDIPGWSHRIIKKSSCFVGKPTSYLRVLKPEGAARQLTGQLISCPPQLRLCADIKLNAFGLYCCKWRMMTSVLFLLRLPYHDFSLSLLKCHEFNLFVTFHCHLLPCQVAVHQCATGPH